MIHFVSNPYFLEQPWNNGADASQIAADNNSQFLENLNYTLDLACKKVVQMRRR